MWGRKCDKSSSQTDAVAGSSETESTDKAKCSRCLFLLSVAQHVTDILDIQFLDDENRDGSWNSGLFAFQTTWRGW
jgi:hypothetical protein